MARVFLMYGLSLGAQNAIRDAYALLQIAQILWLLPHSRRFFCAQRFGGYCSNEGALARFQTPAVIAACFTLWLAVAAAMLFGRAPTLVCATAVNLIFARYFYITTRHNSLLNGIGAVGRINHWLAWLVFLLQLSSAFAGGETLRWWVLLTFRVDFALIIAIAGLYKFHAGYRTRNGVEWALANPRLSTVANAVRKIAPNGTFFHFANHVACVGELIFGMSLLAPPVAPYSAALIALTFVALSAALRLGFLGEMVIVCCALYTPPGSFLDKAFRMLPVDPRVYSNLVAVWFMNAAAGGLAIYLCVLPLAYAGIFCNFYGRRRLREPFQRLLNAWMIFFSLNIWRVVTVDYTTFFFRIFFVSRSTGERTCFMDPAARRSGRFAHIGEFASLSAMFAILKYDPLNFGRFSDVVLRYCATLDVPAGCDVVFQYVSMLKKERFVDVPIAEFRVNCEGSIVTEQVLSDLIDVRKPVAGSRIMQSAKSGTYMPQAPAT